MEAFDSVRLAYGYAQYDYAHSGNFPTERTRPLAGSDACPPVRILLLSEPNEDR
jgi:hypothetical protein